MSPYISNSKFAPYKNKVVGNVVVLGLYEPAAKVIRRLGFGFKSPLKTDKDYIW